MRFSLLMLFILAVLVAGCAGSAAKDPIVPPGPVIDRASGETNRHLWGIWDVYISADRETAEIVPLRSADMHLNALRLLEVAPCKTCLTINNVHPIGISKIEADLTLTHPYPGLLKYTGFDVRGIFISQPDNMFPFPVSGRKIAWGDYVTVMLDPDGYTTLFNPTEFPPTNPPALGYIAGKYSGGIINDLTTTLDPFVAYRRDAPRCMFEAGGSETKTVRLYAPSGSFHFGYAVDVCWQLVENVVDPLTDFPPDANCLEAYAISVDMGSELQQFAGSSVPIGVEVYDHQGQDTISSVTIEAPALFNGEVDLAFSTTMPDGGFLFTGTLSNDLGAAYGDYPLLVKATDTQTDQNLGEVAAWQVSLVNVRKGWARTWGGSDSDEGYSVAIDGSGNVYVTGEFEDTVDFDPGAGVDSHASNGMWDVFLSKFDPNGNFVWARTWGGSGLDGGPSVAIDGSGNAYITGCFEGTVDFDPGAGMDSHASNGYYDVFLSKFDPNGNFVWARTWGGSDWDEGHPVVIDGSGNPSVAGFFSGTVDFNPGAGVDNRTSNGIRDVFLSGFDSNGNLVWARTWGGPGDDGGTSVAIDGSGNAYITGFFEGTANFDPGAGTDNHTSNGEEDAFLSKFDQNGNFIWALSWGGSSIDVGGSVAIDGSGNMYIRGDFMNTVDFDPGAGTDTHSSNGYYDVFLSKFDSNGNFVWARTWGESGIDLGGSAAIDGSGNVYVTGEFEGTVDFDPGVGVDNHSSNGITDIFLSKYDPNGNLVWARTWGGSYDDWGLSVMIDGSGNAYATGSFGDIVEFDPGAGVENHTSNGDYDAFLSKFLPNGNW